MKKIVGIIQEHMFSKQQIKAIEAGFKKIYREHYSETESVVVLWMVMPEGYAYSERKPSEATIIVVEVNEDITQTKREEMMGRFSQFLLNTYKISPLDSVITVANSSWVNAFFSSQRKRVSKWSRPFFTLKMLGTALSSKLSNGYMKLLIRG